MAAAFCVVWAAMARHSRSVAVLQGGDHCTVHRPLYRYFGRALFSYVRSQNDTFCPFANFGKLSGSNTLHGV